MVEVDTVTGQPCVWLSRCQQLDRYEVKKKKGRKEDGDAWGFILIVGCRQRSVEKSIGGKTMTHSLCQAPRQRSLGLDWLNQQRQSALH